MGFVMDLVAGNSRDILLAVAIGDLAAFDDPARFAAHLGFGGSIDPTWLDLFSQAVRSVTGGEAPVDFLEARSELDGPSDAEGHTVESIDPGWITAVAMVDDRLLGAVVGRWIDMLEDELGELAREEKPSVRKFATQIVDFARAADRAPAVLLAWSL